MEIHIVDYTNKGEYLQEIMQDQILRHQVFVDRLGWESLRKPDGLERDEYDDLSTTAHLFLLQDKDVAGGLRLTPLNGPNLLFDHFSHMVECDLPWSRALGADWTRFYVADRRAQRLGPSSPAGALYCAAMQYALCREWRYLTFVSKPAMLEILLSIGWHVTPLGMPRIVEGDVTVAAWIKVDDEALFNAQAYMGLHGSLLRHFRTRGGPRHLPESERSESLVLH